MSSIRKIGVGASKITKRIREPGRCYCGASQLVIVRRRRLSTTEKEKSDFFIVCGRTRKGLRRCM